jgi:serine phosphatase RsbU (regulator of sigma subunit)
MQSEDDDSDRTVIGRGMFAPSPAVQFGHFLSFTENGVLIRRPIPASFCTIGRAAPAEIIIASPEVSRRHCSLEIKNNHAVLTDLGSTNGTRVNGVKIERPTRILSGAQFTLGAFQLRYERRDAREIAEEAELSADLQRAEDYVRAILPQPITAPPIRVEWCFIPSTKLGGDAFGYQYLSDEVFAGFLLDVSGHGIGSAMHAANVANALRRRALPGVDFQDPARVAAAVNDVFPMEEHNGLMLTLWYFVYHLPSRQLRFCSAGHHPSFLLTPAAPDPAPLWQRSPAIGMLPFGKWTSGSAVLPPGSTVFIFSDGVFEIVTGDGQQWSLEDLRQVILQPAIPGLDEPQRLYNAVRAAARPGPFDDDFSVLRITFE